MPAGNKTGAGTPDPAFPGISPPLPPPPRAGEEREARAGWGREESGVWGFLPDYALPSPSLGDTPTVWCMGRCRRRAESGPAPRARFSGDITSTAPAPPGGGGARSAGGVGREESGIFMRYRQAKRTIWISSLTKPFPGSHHDSTRSCAGHFGKGQYGFCRRGGGSLPGPSPGDTPTVRCMR